MFMYVLHKERRMMSVSLVSVLHIGLCFALTSWLRSMKAKPKATQQRAKGVHKRLENR